MLISPKVSAQSNMDVRTIFDFNTITAFLPSKDMAVLELGVALNNVSKGRDKYILKYALSNMELDEVRNFVNEAKPTILYETLFFVKETDFVKQEKIMMKIFNYVRNISIFETIKYRNIKKGHIYPIFLSSREIRGLNKTSFIETLKPLKSLPHQTEQDVVFVLQDMPPFGDVISQYIYKQNKQLLSFRGQNMTDISYKGIRSVKPEDMYISCFILRTNKGILVYGMGGVKVSGGAMLFKGIVSNSFESRMVGLFNWVKNEYDGRPQLK